MYGTQLTHGVYEKSHQMGPSLLMSEFNIADSLVQGPEHAYQGR